MNIAKAREVSILNVLEQNGYLPKVIKNKNHWFLSPFRNENTPSFKVDISLNKWFDFGDMRGGNTLDFVILKFNFKLTEAIHYLSSFNNEEPFLKIEPEEKKAELRTEVFDIEHPALIEYLNFRKIDINTKCLKEVHYRIEDRKYFGVSFRNDSGGLEIRNKYSKLCIGKKDCTTFKNGCDRIIVFEGCFDFFSFKSLFPKYLQSDFLVLNSVALLNKKIEFLKEYKFVELMLDNDEAGNKFTEIAIQKLVNAKDSRANFTGFKDVNEALCSPNRQSDNIS